MPDTNTHRCDNCDWTGTDADLEITLEQIPDLGQRLDPGTGVVPSGECPECGALCYLDLPLKSEPYRPRYDALVRAATFAVNDIRGVVAVRGKIPKLARADKMLSDALANVPTYTEQNPSATICAKCNKPITDDEYNADGPSHLNACPV